MSDALALVERIRAACNGHPHAKIAWPHRILHEAADELERRAAAIERLVAERDEARKALKPFGRLGAKIPAERPDSDLDLVATSWLRRARQALSAEGSKP